MNKKGNVMSFVYFILFLLGFIVFVFSAPILYNIIGVGVEGSGSVTKFVLYSFPLVLLFVLVMVGIKRTVTGSRRV